MAVTSMTGFGAGAAVDGGEEISVELRTVNGKFCEVKARLPRELAALEGPLQKLVKERLSRGNVDAFVRRSSGGLDTVPVVDARLVAAWATSLRQAARDAGLDDTLALKDLLALEGVAKLQEKPADLDAATRALNAALAQALDRLVEVRRREGAALEQDLRTRITLVRSLAKQAATHAQASVAQYRDRLQARIQELLGAGPVDPGRLEQEVVFFADRTDVAEETQRLEAHLDEFDRLLAKDGPVGRQLDFLLQEINREINTTGSKSQSVEVARLVVELKAECERIREQVQNVE